MDCVLFVWGRGRFFAAQVTRVRYTSSSWTVASPCWSCMLLTACRGDCQSVLTFNTRVECEETTCSSWSPTVHSVVWCCIVYCALGRWAWCKVSYSSHEDTHTINQVLVGSGVAASPLCLLIHLHDPDSVWCRGRIFVIWFKYLSSTVLRWYFLARYSKWCFSHYWLQIYCVLVIDFGTEKERGRERERERERWREKKKR